MTWSGAYHHPVWGQTSAVYGISLTSQLHGTRGSGFYGRETPVPCEVGVKCLLWGGGKDRDLSWVVVQNELPASVLDNPDCGPMSPIHLYTLST